MNNRLATSLTLTAIIAALLTACAPAATPIPIASAPLATQPRPYQAPEYEQPAAAEAQSYQYELPAAEAMPFTPAPTMAAPAPNNGMDNYFQDYGVNPQTSTGRDHLSTFALDVDTASYGITRSYIEQGSMPPMDAVRAEEFINAFDQGYETPQDAAFTLYADGGPSPFVRQGNVLLRFGVQGYRVPDYERKPLRLTFVVDASGSMDAENRLELVKDSLHLLVDRLDERDVVAIVAYSDEAWVVLEPTNADDKRRIDRAIDGLYPQNSTNADAGLRLGYKFANHMLDEQAVNRVILCSDGVANVGNTDADSILDFVGRYVENGITLTGIGVGMGNYNDVLLEQLADRGNGNYYYVDDPEAAREIFVENLTSTMQVIAYDAKVQVDFNTDVVASYRLVGYENREVADDDFRDDTVDAGEIGAGMTATALYEVQLKEGAEGRIATAQLRWEDAETREVVEINGNLNTYDLSNSFEDTSPYFQLSAAVAAYAEILRASPYVEGELDDVADEAQRINRLLRENEQAKEFADLASRTARLDGWDW
ncbi:MAG: von Willebrand factor type A domain-containing protein [Anaerolineaceae bacterium]